MKILSHRGQWKIAEEKNSLESFKCSLKNGFGFESDIRDFDGELVISHDIANKNSIRAEKIFQMIAETENKFCFAINIKADGLAEKLKNLLDEYRIENYFVFDMSVPQMIWYKNLGMKFFTRQSEFETSPVLYEEAEGVWMDAFFSDEILTLENINKHLKNGKKVCLVSPELHDRSHKKVWQKLLKVKDDNFYLCTDFPSEAEKFFGGE